MGRSITIAGGALGYAADMAAETLKSNHDDTDPIFQIGTYSLDYNSLGIIISTICVLLTFVLIYFFYYRKNLRRNILLVGLCESGKTLLFSQLIHKVKVDTFTSIKPNSGFYEPTNKKEQLCIIDLPGHERLRLQFFDQYKALTRGIIFVLDSLTFQKDLKDIAQILYSLLSDETVSHNCPYILIACNKQDETFSKSSKVIRILLEKEMNAVRITESASLETTGSVSNNNTFLGRRDKDFEFSHLHPLKIEFANCSALGEKEGPDLQEIEEWLQRIA